jgi:hypothetical protein
MTQFNPRKRAINPNVLNFQQGNKKLNHNNSNLNLPQPQAIQHNQTNKKRKLVNVEQDNEAQIYCASVMKGSIELPYNAANPSSKRISLNHASHNSNASIDNPYLNVNNMLRGLHEQRLIRRIVERQNDFINHNKPHNPNNSIHPALTPQMQQESKDSSQALQRLINKSANPFFSIPQDHCNESW